MGILGLSITLPVRPTRLVFLKQSFDQETGCPGETAVYALVCAIQREGFHEMECCSQNSVSIKDLAFDANITINIGRCIE